MTAFVFDLDGTICFKGQPLQTDILAAFEQLEEDGHEVVFASARPIRDMYPVLSKRYWQYRMIGGNGAFIFNGEKVEVHAFSKEVREKIDELIEEHRLMYLMDSAWDYSFTGSKTHPIYTQLDSLKLAENKERQQLSDWVKCVLFTEDEMIFQSLEAMDCVIHRHQKEGILDISPCGITKEAGLKQLGILPGTYIAFGNDQNDCRMLEEAKISVCVGGNEEVRKYATYGCNEQQVAHMMRQLSNEWKEINI